MSEDTKSTDYKHPRFGDQQDWRKWTQKSKPRLYAIKSKAEPGKTPLNLRIGDPGQGSPKSLQPLPAGGRS